MLQQLDRWLEDGTLTSPAGRPDFLDLFRYLSRPYLSALLPARSSEAGFASWLPAPAERGALLVLVDGLGMASQNLWPIDGFFSRHFQREIASVFPSTTACALSSFASLQTTGNLGLTGWDTYIVETGTVVTMLPFVDRETGEPMTPGTMQQLLPQESVRDDYRVPFRTVLPAAFVDGEYNRWASGESEIVGYEDLSEVLDLVAAEDHYPSVTYLYLPHVDHAEHHHGPQSDETRKEIEIADALLTEIRSRLPQDIPIYATADHGQVGVTADERIEVGPEHPIMEYLSSPPAGEAVQPVFHLSEGKEPAFREYFQDLVGGRMTLVEPAELARRGYFGDEGLHPDTRRRFGDLVGIAGPPIALMYVRDGTEAPNLVGFHGGLRPDEIRVPVFYA